MRILVCRGRLSTWSLDKIPKAAESFIIGKCQGPVMMWWHWIGSAWFQRDLVKYWVRNMNSFVWFFQFYRHLKMLIVVTIRSADQVVGTIAFGPVQVLSAVISACCIGMELQGSWEVSCLTSDPSTSLHLNYGWSRRKTSLFFRFILKYATS